MGHHSVRVASGDDVQRRKLDCDTCDRLGRFVLQRLADGQLPACGGRPVTLTVVIVWHPLYSRFSGLTIRAASCGPDTRTGIAVEPATRHSSSARYSTP